MFRVEEIEIEGYRSIRQAVVPLGNLNVLIGANGAGKSNLLGAVEMLGDIIDKQLQLHVARRGGASALLHFGRKTTPQMKLAMRLSPDNRFAPKAYRFLLEATAGDTLLISQEEIDLEEAADHDLSGGAAVTPRESSLALLPPGVAQLYSPKVFHFQDTSASTGFKQKQPIDDNRTLRPDGKNLAPVLHGLQQRAPRRYREIVESVRAVAPFFKDFALRPDAINAKVLLLEWEHRSEPDQYFNADSLSDGTLRFICLVTLLLQPDKPSLILLDEPELGLHPAAIVHLAELLRTVSKTTQLIVTTQSVELLDQLEPEDVIVTERDGEASVFRRLDKAGLAGWLEDYTLGQLWLKNVLGGRP